ncbi:hypothetical protein, partial [Ciceribacter sp. RN22]|uniref:prealbumin-like fold domain-containing protein n=1 Tax=Ciceribacter sp. RN22 TaxID=2954932 RepID=UPI0020921314
MKNLAVRAFKTLVRIAKREPTATRASTAISSTGKNNPFFPVGSTLNLNGHGRLASYASVLTVALGISAVFTTTDATAQSLPTLTCESNGSVFNTGYNATTGGKLASGLDANWDVALWHAHVPAATAPPAGLTYNDAVVLDNPPSGYMPSPFNNATWIGERNTGMHPDQPAQTDWDGFFRYRFNLDPAVAPESLSLSVLTFYADNSVVEIWVNGVAQGIHSNYGATDPYWYVGFVAGSGASGEMNGPWQTGFNEIVVHIVSGPGAIAFLAQMETTALCKPKLTLQKTVVNDNGGTSQLSDFTLTASGNTPMSGASGSPEVTGAEVAPGTYTLAETGPAGYIASSYSCSIDGGAATSGNSVALENGNAAVCTITNDDIPPTVTMAKSLLSESGSLAGVAEPG